MLRPLLGSIKGLPTAPLSSFTDLLTIQPDRIVEPRETHGRGPSNQDRHPVRGDDLLLVVHIVTPDPGAYEACRVILHPVDQEEGGDDKGKQFE